MKKRYLRLMVASHLALNCAMNILPAHVLAKDEPGKQSDEETREWVDPMQVLEIGKRGDRSNIPYLRRIKSRKVKHKNSAAYNAQMALARLGEARELDEIIAETESSDPGIQAEGIEKLAYVANEVAIRKLVDLLNDPSKYRRAVWIGPDGKKRHSDVIYEPPSLQACRALSKIVPDGPQAKKKFLDKDDVAAWKKWWKKNRQKYEHQKPE